MPVKVSTFFACANIVNKSTMHALFIVLHLKSIVDFFYATLQALHGCRKLVS